MNARLLGFGALALACVGAAGTGAYLAVRQNAVNPVPAASPASTMAADTAGVTEREADAAATAATTEVAPAPTGSAASAPVETRSPAAASGSKPAPSAPRSAATDALASEPVPSEPAPPDTSDPPVPDVPALPVPLVPADTPEPPSPEFEEVVVPAGAVIGLQVENSVSSETARLEDQVTARVTRDVRAGGMVTIPAGTRALGSVVLVVRGGKFKERARLGVRFHTLITAEGAVPIQTEAVFREGESPAGESTAKVSAGAIGGAIIGAIVGGRRGAAIGTAAGAGAGAAAAAAGERNDARLVAGSNVTVRLSQPVTFDVPR